MTLHDVLNRFDGVKQISNGQFMVKCPCHDDRKASLSIGTGNDGRVVLNCMAGCSTADILERVGLSMKDLFNNNEPQPDSKPQIVATYDYRAKNGTLLAQKLRKSDKSFSWRRPDGKGGWIYNRQSVPHTLYVAGQADQTVYVVEGEKDADNLAKLGCFCVSGEDGAGHGKWLPEYTEMLTGRSILILPDNDQIGHEYANEVAESVKGAAKSVKILDLATVWPDMPSKGDISDMILNLGVEKTCSLLVDLERKTSEWNPKPKKSVFDEFGFYSIPDLTEEEKRPPEFLVEGMIPCGMTFISGAPKIRKSFFALQMAAAIATGQQFLGLKTTKCDVAYLDLEGSKSRSSFRAEKMTTQIPRNVFITNSITERLANGLVDKLRELHRQRPSIRLIIIDTYSRARGSFRAGSANAYDADVSLLEPIQRMALEENIAVVFVHHDKKGAGFATDSFERLSGTMGISGSADAVLNLVADGKRFDCKATLEYTPRDAKGGEMKLVFDERFNEWQQVVETPADIRGNPVCDWLISCELPKRKEGQFFSYEEVFRSSYNYQVESPGEKIREQIEKCKDELFLQFGIGVQLGVQSNSKRGIRAINLL